jgi:hypothetical protein
MFKGNSKVELNEATVIEALQEYVDKRLAPGFIPIKIMSVKPKTDGYQENKFVIETNAIENGS